MQEDDFFTSYLACEVHLPSLLFFSLIFLQLLSCLSSLE